MAAVHMNKKQYLKMAAQSIFLPFIYALFRLRPVRAGRVVFADAHHSSRPESMEELIKELKERGGFEIVETYLDYGRASFPKLLMHMTKFMKLYAGAGAVVLCDNFLPAAGCKKRRETLVVQLWHACGALKRFGYDTDDDIPSLYRGNVFKNTDIVTVSAPFCIKPFSSAMRLGDGQIQALGVCRTDRYFDGAWKNSVRERFYRELPEAKGKRVALWAPTFRGSPGSMSCISLDINRLENELERLTGEKWMVMAKLHPHIKELPAGAKPCSLSSEELFETADVLIADYSSLIYEYVLFDKPLVLYIPDYEDYFDRRGFYMPHEEIPGVRVYEEAELPGAVAGALRLEREDETVHTERKKFVEKYMTACDGMASKRTADIIAAHAAQGRRHT